MSNGGDLAALEETVEFGAPFGWFRDQPNHQTYVTEALNLRDKVSAIWKTPIGNDFADTAQRLRDLRY